jgi:hypothetical protein
MAIPQALSGYGMAFKASKTKIGTKIRAMQSRICNQKLDHQSHHDRVWVYTTMALTEFQSSSEPIFSAV